MISKRAELHLRIYRKQQRNKARRAHAYTTISKKGKEREHNRHEKGTDKNKFKHSQRAIMITDYTAIPQLHREIQRLGKKMVAVYVTAPPGELLNRQARRLETGEYEDEDQLEQRMAELRNEIEKETKIKSLADYVIMEEDIPATITRAKELANQIQ